MSSNSLYIWLAESCQNTGCCKWTEKNGIFFPPIELPLLYHDVHISLNSWKKPSSSLMKSSGARIGQITMINGINFRPKRFQELLEKLNNFFNLKKLLVCLTSACPFTVAPSCHQDYKNFQDMRPLSISNLMLRVQDFEGIKKI